MPEKVQNIEKAVQILERVMGEKITSIQCNKWLQNIQKKKIKKSDFFIKAGEKPQQIALIESGILRIYCIDRDGNEITKVFAGENKIVSLYYNLILGNESDYYVEALEDTELYIINYQEILEELNNNLWLLRFIKKCLEDALIYKEQRELSFLSDTAKERYCKFLEEYRELEERVNQSYIASYLGIVPESLSRIRRSLRDGKE